MVQSVRIRLPCLVALLAWALGGVSTLAAQQAQPQTTVTVARPRIGLALGGGAARGLAHIGVLRWFEEHRIPIDLITGTSMGGLIAGAYASGMTPDEIAQLMRTTDWDAMFVADSPFKYKTFRRKQDKRAYPSQLEFGLKGGFQLPGGLNPGQQVSLLLDQIALPYWDLKSFDDLPTPFRCVATDLRKGDAVVLSKGPLARAMRATMAIPGVFTPVNYDDWLLVDGGTLNNIPADVARDMGAGHVIAVNVGADAVNDKEAESLFALLGRTIDTMMATGTRRALKSADVIIDPDLKGLGSTDWRRSDDLAQRGYAAAEAMADKLTPLALGPEEYAAIPGGPRRQAANRGADGAVRRSGRAAAAALAPRRGDHRPRLPESGRRHARSRDDAHGHPDRDRQRSLRVPDVYRHREGRQDRSADRRPSQELRSAVPRAGPRAEQPRFLELRGEPWQGASPRTTWWARAPS